MLYVTLDGPKGGTNKTFTLSNRGVGIVVIVHAGRLLKEVPKTPGPYEFTLEGLIVTVGTAPQPADMLFAYIETDATQSLEEVQLNGLQNNTNVFFLLYTRIPPGTSLILFQNGAVLEPVPPPPHANQYTILLPQGADYEAADFEPADFYTEDAPAEVPLPIIIQLGTPPGPTDKLRAFLAVPATALMERLVVTGNQDSANTRYTLSGYAPAASTEPTFWITVDGLLQLRTLVPPLTGQYLMPSPVQFILGVAPAPATALEVILIGSTVVQATTFQFTLDKMSRRLGIWLARGLDQAECEEVIRETYREYMEMYQWSFLMYEGAFTTNPTKTKGTVHVTEGARVVQGTGTAFTTKDIGMRLRVGSSDPDYEVTAVDSVTQRLEIHPAYADATALTTGYTLVQTIYNLGVDAAYIFSMVGQSRLVEIPLSTLNSVDPTRSGAGGDSVYFAYRGRSERDELSVELYPAPSTSSVIRYSAIRRAALTDGAQALRGIETLILNGAAAAGCRIAMAKGGKSTMEMWLQLMQSYEAKAAQILDRLDSLDLTRSDVAKVQGMRGDGGTALDPLTHDTEW